MAHREIARLVEARVLRDRRDGNNRLVSANRDVLGARYPGDLSRSRSPAADEQAV